MSTLDRLAGPLAFWQVLDVISERPPLAAEFAPDRTVYNQKLTILLRLRDEWCQVIELLLHTAL